MDKITRRHHEAAQMRRKAERDAAAERLYAAERAGFARGRQTASADLASAVPGDFARYVVEHAGSEFARMIAAAVYDKNPSLSRWAAEAAENVWREVTVGRLAGGNPLPLLQAYARQALDGRAVELRVAFPAMDFSHRVERFELKMFRR